MPERQMEIKLPETFEKFEEIVLKIAVRLKRQYEKDTDDLTNFHMKNKIIFKEIDMVKSTWYNYALNYRINSKYDSVKYIKDTGKFEINVKQFLQNNDLMQKYNDRLDPNKS